MMLLTMLLVAVAGACGALARAGLAHTVATKLPSAMPWGTWAVNLLGSFLLGALFVIAAHFNWPMSITIAIGAGFLGAFTTFSTWMYETARLLEDRAWRTAVINIIGPLAIGPPLVFAGAWMSEWMIRVIG